MDDDEMALCTVTPSIFAECFNDTISTPGTCYEDSCCMSVEMATSWHYRLSQSLHIVFSVAGILTAIAYLTKYSRKHILPFNIRVLITIILILIIIHSFDMAILHMHHIHKSFDAANFRSPCSIRNRVGFCAPFRYTYSFCILTLAICQYTIYAERIVSILWRHYQRHYRRLLVGLLVHMFALSIGLIVWVYRNENSDAYLLSCLNVPLESMMDLTLVTAILFPINVFCLLLSIFLFRSFRSQQKLSRFDVKKHFKASVDVDSCEFLWRTTATQAIFIIAYPILSITMRYFYEYTPRPIHVTWATSSYVFSVYSFAVPSVMLHYVRNYQLNRRERIWNHVKLKSVGVEGADNYFNSLKNQWGG
ncbi:unnamed protein product [Caenorhabditis bovis]|uniref:Uncharacterized protein n=1 Tax=Caenorhabditis bovis TaxID=2654633 RepID=A0A8S1EB29_9PELO|nr:unnamed protein product [Caenorhabditis bovis]